MPWSEDRKKIEIVLNTDISGSGTKKRQFTYRWSQRLLEKGSICWTLSPICPISLARRCTLLFDGVALDNWGRGNNRTDKLQCAIGGGVYLFRLFAKAEPMLVPITPFPNPTCTRVSLVANPRIALDGYLLQIISTNPGPLALWLLLLSIMNESESPFDSGGYQSARLMLSRI